MGDRANIVVQYEDGKKIYFYGHWSGNNYFQRLQYALSFGWSRRNDPAYLARIIFDVFRGDDADPLTGFGIAPYPPDNEHDYLVVDPRLQQVSRTDEKFHHIQDWTFLDFITAPRPEDL